MAKAKETTEVQTPTAAPMESIMLETRKVKALEKIANSIDALTVWFEEIDKKEWGERLAWYLYEWHTMAKSNFEGTTPTPSNNSNTQVEDAPSAPTRKIRPKKDIESV
jgi:hypothetical protein